ncbi:MAG: TetR/AcrR family transcriptional regulator [Clostridiales bacterium]|nr:TetR/AcrR family transcriptional regulator [Clostridiales bacterium]
MPKNKNSTDSRIKRTRKAIRNAFFDVVEEKGFERTSVKDITDRAMISRNTFYLHYGDKFDLLNKIIEEITTELFHEVGEQLQPKKHLQVNSVSAARIMKIGISAIEKDKRAYKILLTNSDTDALSSKLEEVIRTSLKLIGSRIEAIDDYSIEYVVSGFIGLIKYHVSREDDTQELDCQNFAELHLGNIITALNESRKSR